MDQAEVQLAGGFRCDGRFTATFIDGSQYDVWRWE